jgi:hypothetical protein
MSEEGDDTQSQTQAETAEPEVAPSLFGNIMDVLMPATPPEPKNARIIRQFDLEAAKNDARPAAEAPATNRSQPERRTREEARAFRNRSLRAAAGLD